MNKVLPFKKPSKPEHVIREEACQWIARIDAGMSNEDVQALEEWFAENNRNVEILLEIAKLWDNISVLSELASIFPLDRYSTFSKKSTQSYGRGWIAAAASICAAVLIGFGFIYSDIGALNEGENFTAFERYETDVGERLEIDLPDGSRVTLNTNSLLEIAYTESGRNVLLMRGEGLFAVAKNKDRPFRVFAGAKMIEAVGTAFTVQLTEENNVEVLVTEGAVNFNKLNKVADVGIIQPGSDYIFEKTIPLLAGEFIESTLNGDSESISQLESSDMQAEIAWQHGMMLFKNERLDQAIKEVMRYTNVKIDIDESIREIRVEGYFGTGDIQGLIVALGKNFKINAEYISETHIVLTKE